MQKWFTSNICHRFYVSGELLNFPHFYSSLTHIFTGQCTIGIRRFIKHKFGIIIAIFQLISISLNIFDYIRRNLKITRSHFKYRTEDHVFSKKVFTDKPVSDTVFEKLVHILILWYFWKKLFNEGETITYLKHKQIWKWFNKWLEILFRFKICSSKFIYIHFLYHSICFN